LDQKVLVMHSAPVATRDAHWPRQLHQGGRKLGLGRTGVSGWVLAPQAVTGEQPGAALPGRASGKGRLRAGNAKAGEQ